MNSFYEYINALKIPFDPSLIVDSCIENGHSRLLMDFDALTPEFFDLSNRLTGTMVHRLTVYGVRMAVVIPDTSKYSQSFQSFVREANKGKQFRFAPTRDEAIAWLNGV